MIDSMMDRSILFKKVKKYGICDKNLNFQKFNVNKSHQDSNS